MAWSTGRLSTAPDDYSDVVDGSQTQKERPPYRMRQTSGLLQGPGRQQHPRSAGQCRHTLEEGADMAQRTRTPGRSDSVTRDSAVKITPASSVSATVPSTSTTR